MTSDRLAFPDGPRLCSRRKAQAGVAESAVGLVVTDVVEFWAGPIEFD